LQHGWEKRLKISPNKMIFLQENPSFIAFCPRIVKLIFSTVWKFKYWQYFKYKPNLHECIFFSKISDEKIIHEERMNRIDSVFLENDKIIELGFSAYSIACEWFKISETTKQATQYENCSLAEVIQWLFFYEIFNVLKIIEQYKKIIETKSEAIKYVGNPLYYDLFSQLCKKSGKQPRSDLFFNVNFQRRYSNVFKRQGLKKERKKRKPYIFNTSNKKVLFLSNGRSIANIYRALIRKVHERQDLNYSIFDTGSGASVFEKDSITCNNVFSYTSAKKIKKCNVDFTRSLGLIFQELKERKYFSYADVSFFSFIQNRLKIIFSLIFPELASSISVIRTVIETEKPDIIITGFDSNILEMLFIRIGQQMGIPSITIQDGDFYPYCPRKINADFTVVQGEIVKEQYITFGVDPEKIVISGQPRYDYIFNGELLINTAQFKSTHSISDNQKIIVFATDPGSVLNTKEKKRKYEDIIIKEATGKSEYFLVLKLHPQDTGEITMDLVSKYSSSNILIIKDMNADELMSMCDLWLTTYSTTALESVMMKKPLLLLNFDKENYLQDFVKEGVAEYIETKERVLPLFEKALFDEAWKTNVMKNREAFLKRRLFKCDGKASDRVLETIRKIAR